ncbi:bcl-2-like protein 12 isoform X4 [Loxodonta africana]|uniref:bcl-2-like protein 12 isoform X4 n=1 Tax=Loxodonta africana TaxID=9785 RepID=UPI0030D13AC6
MAGSEELGLREDTLRVLAAFLRRGEAAGSPVTTPPRSPSQEQSTDFLSRLRRCLPCAQGQGAVPPESPRPCSLPLRPCYGSEPGGHPGPFSCGLELTPGLRSSSEAAANLDVMPLLPSCASAAFLFPLRAARCWPPHCTKKKEIVLKLFILKDF